MLDFLQHIADYPSGDGGVALFLLTLAVIIGTVKIIVTLIKRVKG